MNDTEGHSGLEQFVLVSGGGLYLPTDGHTCFWSRRQVVVETGTTEHYLGTYRGQACYAIEFEQGLDEDGEIRGLRSLLGTVPDDLFNMLGRALQICAWHRDHQFCGRCGNPTTEVINERARYCSACVLSFYPRISPCVIVVIRRGQECLLARNTRWQANYFSAIAGFIEPGETVEQALCREVLEEVSIKVENIRYFASQPWPFPGQLMLGYHADYQSGEIRVDGVEIAEARWYPYDSLPPGPNPHSLSGRLISDFVSRCRQAHGV